MKSPFKRNQESSGAYEQLVKIQLQHEIFEKRYFDEAARLERKRNNGKEYVR